MPDTKTIQQQVRDRVRELETLIEPLRIEAEQLRKVDELFTNGQPSEPAPPRRRRRSAARAAKPPTRRRTGPRAQQALRRIATQPGITVPELAKALGMQPNYLYRVLPGLVTEGKILKQGRGYHAVPVE